MKFISVRRLAAVLKLEVSRIDDELIENLRRAVNLHFLENDVLHTFAQDFAKQDLIFILDSLKEEKVRVFHEWIYNDNALSEYLISSGEILTSNEEVILSKEHQLFIAYQIFLANYLVPILNHKTAKSIKEGDLNSLENHLSFSPLLPENSRIAIQQPTSAYLRQLLAQLKVSQGVDLQDQLQLVFSFDFVNVLNELDESFYSDSIEYIDTAKLVVKKNELSPLISDQIKSVILSVRLNEKDQRQVREFCNSGAFDAKCKTPRSSFNNIVRSPLFFVVVIAIVINFIFFYPLEESLNNNGEGGFEEDLGDSWVDNKETNSFPYIIDTFNFKASYKVFREQNIANYRPLYFGVKKDTLEVNYDLHSYYLPPSEVYEVIEDSAIIKKRDLDNQQLKINNDKYSTYFKERVIGEYPNWENSIISITINTTQLIRNIGETRYQDSTIISFAYPVILENISDSTIQIGYDSYLPLILEAKDENGKWEAIETLFSSSWLNGVTILLPKGEIVLTSVPVLESGEKKEFRLKIGENYSEVFGGWGK